MWSNFDSRFPEGRADSRLGGNVTCRMAPSDVILTTTVARRCACTTSSRLAAIAISIGNISTMLAAIRASRNMGVRNASPPFFAQVYPSTYPPKLPNGIWVYPAQETTMLIIGPGPVSNFGEKSKVESYLCGGNDK